MKVFILTIKDMANFGKEEHRSAWRTQNMALYHAKDIVQTLVERDKHHGLGDTFNVDVEEMEVGGYV